MKPLVALLLALLPLAAGAQVDYAQQWPVTLSRQDAGAYRIQLTPDVYAAARWRDLRDVQVLDADDRAMTSEVLAAPTPPAPATHTVDLRWFALPPAAAADSDVLDVEVVRDATGVVTSIRHAAANAEKAPPAPRGWLIDRGIDAGRLRALSVSWTDQTAPVEAHLRLEGSADLRHWQVLDPDVVLLQLGHGGAELRQSSAEVDTALRYLRLLPRASNPVLVPARFVGSVRDAAPQRTWLWVDATAAGKDQGGFVYHVDGRFPIERLAVELAPNSTARWSVASRDADTVSGDREPAWRTLATGWTTWNLVSGDQRQTSMPLELATPLANRDWRLTPPSDAQPAVAPQLRLGYRVGSMLFLAQGTPPYRLVAGRVSAKASHADLQPMLADLRARNGSNWQAAAATLGAGSQLAGAAAYRPEAVSRDWKAVLLWGLLALGSLIVGGFAMSLVRGKPPGGGSP